MPPLARSSSARSPSARLRAASSAQNGSRASRVSIRSTSLMRLPRMSMLTELAIDLVVGRCTNAPPARPALTRTRFCTSRMRSASRTVALLICVCLTSSRSAGSGAPSASSPLRIRSRSSLASTSDALGTSTGLSLMSDREGAPSAASITCPSWFMVRPKIPFISFGRYRFTGARWLAGEKLMRWELSEEQELFTTSLREWLGERAGSAAVRGWLDAGDLASFERLFVGEGWAGVGFDEELGGQGGGLLELALTAREMGRAAAPSASWLQSAIVVPALADEPALMRETLESGEITALAVRADRIPAAASSVASSEGRLRGQIKCVLGAARSRRLLVPVSDGETTSLWLVGGGDAGVGVHPGGLFHPPADVV